MTEMTMDDMVLVSVDDHVVEPPDAFLRHFPERLKSRAPVVERVGTADLWVWDKVQFGTSGLNAVAGRPKSEYGREPVAYEQMREGCYRVQARIDDMNANGVLGSMCFPSFPSYAGSVLFKKAESDPEVALAAVRAYNDWHVHEWCAAAPGRFIPLIILPLWDLAASLEEVRRMSVLGVHAASFPDNPDVLGLPALHGDHWEPLWKAFSDARMVINCHIGSGDRPGHASPSTPITAWITSFPMSISMAAANWLNASFWRRYPDLRMALSEGGIGWIPYLLERADFTQVQHGEWTNVDFGGEKPSDVFKRHILTCFIDDIFGIKNLDSMNEDMVCWECDYPHSDTLWPQSPECIWASVKQLPREKIDKITHRNAMREYSYDPFSIIGRENCTVAALRAKATHVDIRPKSNLGGLGTQSMESADNNRRPVTSGEINDMFARVDKH